MTIIHRILMQLIRTRLCITMCLKVCQSHLWRSLLYRGAASAHPNCTICLLLFL